MTESSLARSSAVMAGGTVVSRALGFVRATMLAAVIGTTGLAADAFDVANTLPNLFFLLLAGGVLNAVLVPQITKAAAHDDGGHEFVNRLLTISIALIAGGTVLVTAAAPLLVRAFADFTDARAVGLATAFAFICLPQMFFYGLYTVLGQVLNARAQFGAYMWAPALANVVMIGGLLVLLTGFPTQVGPAGWTPAMVWILGGTTTLGIVAQALVLVVPLRRGGFRFTPVWGFRGTGLGSASRVALWTFAALAVSQLGFVVTSRVLTRATGLLDRSHQIGAGKATYSNAFLLFMLPHSLITLSLVTALFTRMSTAASAGRTAEVVADLGRGLRLPAVLLVPGMVAAVLFGEPLVRLLFFGNSAAATRPVAHVMIAMMVGILPFGWLYLIQRVFYAYEDARTPFLLQLVVTGIATAVNLYAFTVDPRQAGVVVGIGQTLSNLVAALVGFALLRRRLGALALHPTVRLYARLAVASLVAGLVAWPLDRLLAAGLPDTHLTALLEVVVGGGVFLVLALVLSHLLRVEEVGQLFDPVLRRLRRRSS
ncbi:murein biosynthesis integral membrane protein MurJ [Pedococcus sp. NPDC057267]|uniref:murein biosynthesis integral membrane protein MurJ n=1 Tax=Pedococcus sp. NPDC057267 TaxID=3346077 RepID=UPI0036331669